MRQIYLDIRVWTQHSILCYHSFNSCINEARTVRPDGVDLISGSQPETNNERTNQYEKTAQRIRRPLTDEFCLRLWRGHESQRRFLL